MVNPMIGDQGRGIYRADPAAYTGTKASLVNFTGAAISLALVVGLGVWGYQTVMRDVSGVPVVRALEGPMREAPESPGGTIANHQGLAVNSVQADGVAEPPADTLVLAPETALLSEEDQPKVLLRTAPPARPAESGEEVMTQASLTQNEAPTDPFAAALALAEQLAEQATPFAPVTEEAGTVGEPQEIELAAAPVAEPEAVKPKSGIASSPRPAPRPAGRRAPALADVVQVRAGPSDTTLAAAAALADEARTNVQVGTRLVQLGAFDTEADARKLWDSLRSSDSFRALMGDKSPVIQEAQSGGRTFFRLRAVGFADLSDARRFCAALVAEKADCIPVVAR